VIRSWRNAATRRFPRTGKGRWSGLDEQRARLRLSQLDAAQSLDDLAHLRSVGLHKLSGDRAGHWASSTARGGWCSASAPEMPTTSKLSTTTEGPLMPFHEIHPGVTLKEELEARGLSPAAAALRMRVPPQRLHEIVRGASHHSRYRASAKPVSRHLGGILDDAADQLRSRAGPQGARRPDRGRG
jgi:toxin HigB-1